MRRLRLFAGEGELTGEKASRILQKFAQEWRKVPVPNRKEAAVSMDPAYRLSEPALQDLKARLRVIGMNLNKSGLKGLAYHNMVQRQIAALAATFDCRGWIESPALFDDPEAQAQGPVQLAGRVDVIWARDRIPVAVFEVDSTVKPRSLAKLIEAAAPHKFWVYFGKDVWNFRTFLQKNDLAREITAVLIPQTFVPSFDDQQP